MDEIKKYIREVPNFPKPGILFYDITTLMQDSIGFRLAVSSMEKYVSSRGATKIAAIESRGFFFGGAIADRLGLSMVPVRKPGKLPSETISEEYDLEYGTDKLEMHKDAINDGDRVVIVDDLIATGGTLEATCNMVQRLGGEVAGISTVIDLSFLPWREKLAAYDVNYLISYDSEEA
ncbi:MAG: adenine phosphoribosyltransferase [bacterium]|nr:adenine phosphoribosyltransferase [bacterium]